MGQAPGGVPAPPLAHFRVPKDQAIVVKVGQPFAVHLTSPPGKALRWSLDSGFESLVSVDKRPLFQGPTDRDTESTFHFRANHVGRTAITFLLEDLDQRKTIARYRLPVSIAAEKVRVLGMKENGQRVELSDGTEFLIQLPGGVSRWQLMDATPNLLERQKDVGGSFRFRVNSMRDSGITLPIMLRNGSQEWRLYYRVIRAK